MEERVKWVLRRFWLSPLRSFLGCWMKKLQGLGFLGWNMDDKEIIPLLFSLQEFFLLLLDITSWIKPQGFCFEHKCNFFTKASNWSSEIDSMKHYEFGKLSSRKSVFWKLRLEFFYRRVKKSLEKYNTCQVEGRGSSPIGERDKYINFFPHTM